jgi:hypothetical protein
VNETMGEEIDCRGVYFLPSCCKLDRAFGSALLQTNSRQSSNKMAHGLSQGRSTAVQFGTTLRRDPLPRGEVGRVCVPSQVP